MAFPEVKAISILGVTGSVGQSTQDVILANPERFDVKCVTAHRSAKALAEAAIRLNADSAVIADYNHFAALKEYLDGTDIVAKTGEEALLESSLLPVDVMVCAIVGIAGLKPLLNALSVCKAVAIANKEPLVAAGPLVMKTAHQHSAKILPIDSEHNAIFQVFDRDHLDTIERIILTASGGPFRTMSVEEMRFVSPDQAVRHPNWTMGPKISVDSATMMNKALEIIEAHILFEIAADAIDVLVHPQSIVHSMVEYCDGSVLAQLGASDMRTPIASVLDWPLRLETPGKKLSLEAIAELTFEPVDHEKFPAINLAYRAIHAGQEACIAMNAANEVAVELFLQKKIGFSDILDIAKNAVDETNALEIRSLDDILAYDADVKARIHNRYNNETFNNKNVIAQ